MAEVYLCMVLGYLGLWMSRPAGPEGQQLFAGGRGAFCVRRWPCMVAWEGLPPVSRCRCPPHRSGPSWRGLEVSPRWTTGTACSRDRLRDRVAVALDWAPSTIPNAQACWKPGAGWTPERGRMSAVRVDHRGLWGHLGYGLVGMVLTRRKPPAVPASPHWTQVLGCHRMLACQTSRRQPAGWLKRDLAKPCGDPVCRTCCDRSPRCGPRRWQGGRLTPSSE